jgi:hypothetical protein
MPSPFPGRFAVSAVGKTPETAEAPAGPVRTAGSKAPTAREKKRPSLC